MLTLSAARRPLLGIAVAVAGAILAACVADVRPVACDGPATIELTLTSNGLTPSDPVACRDQ